MKTRNLKNKTSIKINAASMATRRRNHPAYQILFKKYFDLKNPSSDDRLIGQCRFCRRTINGTLVHRGAFTEHLRVSSDFFFPPKIRRFVNI